MEVESEFAGFLSNFEVYALLCEPLSEKDTQHQDLQTITYNTKHYLEETDCPAQSEETINAFVTAMQEFALLKHELLQLLNTRPLDESLLIALIDDFEERFPDESTSERMLQIISSTLPAYTARHTVAPLPPASAAPAPASSKSQLPPSRKPSGMDVAEDEYEEEGVARPGLAASAQTMGEDFDEDDDDDDQADDDLAAEDRRAAMDDEDDDDD